MKDDLEMRRQHLDSIEGEDSGLNFVKPLDHEKFHAVIGAWRLTSGNPNPELQLFPRDEEHHKHHRCCNGQHQQEVLVNSVYEGDFNSPEA